MKTYSEKLRDPRWQRKRLEIMQRDNFACTQCGDSKSTLNIHHWKYSGDPWEAGDQSLSTVCEKCHREIEHKIRSSEEMRKTPRILPALDANLHLGDPSLNYPQGGFFRFLKDGEKLKEGDEFWDVNHWWHFGHAIGDTYRTAISPIARRKCD